MNRNTILYDGVHNVVVPSSECNKQLAMTHYFLQRCGLEIADCLHSCISQWSVSDDVNKSSSMNNWMHTIILYKKKTRCFCLPLSFIWFIDVILRYCLLKSAPIRPNRTIHHSNYSMLWQTVPFTINYSKLFYSCERHMNRTGSLHQCYNGISGILCLCEFIFVEGVVGKGVTVCFLLRQRK